MTKFLILLILFSCTQQPRLQKKYVRTDWHHWSDLDKNCRNTRQEILAARSEIPAVFNKKGCTVVKGKWVDYYYPETHTLAKFVDIDHLIPLKHAHDSGGSNWSAAQKEKFANDWDNLVITNRKYNRTKGAKRIDEWLPVHKEYACKYIGDWIKIKKKYALTFTPQEEKTIAQSSCENLKYP
jgi:Protein of unknown function (DUF1524)